MTSKLTQKRLRFDKCQTFEESGGRCSVEVTLSHGERIFSAREVDSSGGIGPLKAAARAALRAVELSVDNRLRCSLNDLDHVSALGKNLIAVLVDAVFEGRDVQVFGSCQITDDPVNASIKSILNATNRMVELSMRATDQAEKSDKA